MATQTREHNEQAAADAPRLGHTLAEASRLSGVDPETVRQLVADGFLAPVEDDGGERYFGFQDLVVLRATRALHEAHIPPRRIRQALKRVAERLPRGQHLAGVKILSAGEQVVVRDDRSLWNAESGQVLLDFATGGAEETERATSLAPAIAMEPERSAEDWYELAGELEQAAPPASEGAEEAYRRAIALDPGFYEAVIDLGLLLHEAGRVREAAECYEHALGLRPDEPTAAFNLGVALEDLDRPDGALEAYRQALRADPDHADAHYNAARLCERRGEREAALRHLQEYRRLRRG